MSAIRKIPFIETKIKSLTEEQLEALLSAINSSPDADKVVSLVDNNNLVRTYIENEEYLFDGVTLELERGKAVRSGILCYDGTNTYFLAYFSYQDIDIYSINPTNNTYEKIKEQCSIEELRRIIGDASSGSGSGSSLDPTTLAQVLKGGIGATVDINQAGTEVLVNIDLTDAEDGYVLTADKTNNTVSWAKPVGIADSSTTSTTDTWSASKLNTVIGDIESLLNSL